MKSKKSIIALSVLIFIILVSATLAYFTSTSSFNNLFQAAIYKTVTTEYFESPDNWLPGTETAKTVTVKNEGTVPVRVRVSYEEEWKDFNNNTLPLEESGKKAAIINFDNEDDWNLKDGYYYYMKELDPNEVTSSFIKSVTFNSEITGNISCTLSADGKTQNCESVNGYDDATFKLTIKVETVQADAYKEVWNVDETVFEKIVSPASFDGDSWKTIIAAVRDGNTENYNVGDEKEVDLGKFGSHKLRIANKETPEECSTTGFSQTACGFVLEFADIITTHNMSSTNTNVGGWNASDMRAYVNSDIYNALPEEVRNSIIETTVVSGHGKTAGEENFTTTDKLYLLSTKEVGYNMAYDTAKAETRTLDYYNTNNTNATRIKNSEWWLRSAYSYYDTYFLYVANNGNWNGNYSTNSRGVSPAFRIA